MDLFDPFSSTCNSGQNLFHEMSLAPGSTSLFLNLSKQQMDLFDPFSSTCSSGQNLFDEMNIAPGSTSLFVNLVNYNE